MRGLSPSISEDARSHFSAQVHCNWLRLEATQLVFMIVEAIAHGAVTRMRSRFRISAIKPLPSSCASRGKEFLDFSNSKNNNSNNNSSNNSNNKKQFLQFTGSIQERQQQQTKKRLWVKWLPGTPKTDW